MRGGGGRRESDGTSQASHLAGVGRGQRELTRRGTREAGLDLDDGLPRGPDELQVCEKLSATSANGRTAAAEPSRPGEVPDAVPPKSRTPDP